MELRFSKDAAWHPTGLKVTVSRNHGDDPSYRVCLTLKDLNPESVIVHSGSRWEIFRLGLWIAMRALTARR